MKRKAFVLTSLVLIACSGRLDERIPVARESCPAGTVTMAAGCQLLCGRDPECGKGRCVDGACVSDESGVQKPVLVDSRPANGVDPTADTDIQRPAPVGTDPSAVLTDPPAITAVTGTGSVDDSGAQRLHDRLVVQGAHLADARITLSGNGKIIDLSDCSSRSAGRAELLLPADLLEGTYTLTAVNEAGACNASLQILRGESGQAADVHEIARLVKAEIGSAPVAPSGSIAGLVTTFSLVADAAATANQRSILVNGMEAIESHRERAGIYLVAIDVVTHEMVRDLNAPMSYTASDGEGLAEALNSFSSDLVVVLASAGDISRMASTENLQSALTWFGATTRFSTVAADQAYAFIGRKGQQMGVERISTAELGGRVELSSLLVDSGLLGSDTPPQPPASLSLLSHQVMSVDERDQVSLSRSGGGALKLQNTDNGTAWWLRQSNGGADLMIGNTADTADANAKLSILSDGSMYSPAAHVLTYDAPTIYLRDTDHSRGAALHMNTNHFHVLPIDNNLAIAPNNGEAPLVINLENNDARFGGNLSIARGLSVEGPLTWTPTFNVCDSNASSDTVSCGTHKACFLTKIEHTALCRLSRQPDGGWQLYRNGQTTTACTAMCLD